MNNIPLHESFDHSPVNKHLIFFVDINCIDVDIHIYVFIFLFSYLGLKHMGFRINPRHTP